MATKKKIKRKINSYSHTKSVKEQVESIKEEFQKTKKKKIVDLTRKLKVINKKIEKNDFTCEDINSYLRLLDEQKSLKQEIKNIENDENIKELEEYSKFIDIDSFSSNSENDILYKPRDDDNAIKNTKVLNRFLKTSSTPYPVFEQKESSETKSIEVDYVEINPDDQLLEDQSPQERSIIKSYTYTPLRDADDPLVDNNKSSNNNFTLKDNMGLKKINPIHEKIIDYRLIAPKSAEKFICPTCACSLIHDENRGILSCTICGLQRDYFDASNNTGQSFYTNKKNFGTQKINNQFDKILNYFDPEKWIEIEDSAYEEIIQEIRMTENVSYVSALRIRDILKKKKMRAYYRNVVQIYSHLNGKPVPIMTKELKAEFQQKFKMLKIPCDKHKGDRKNFLSYPLVFKKLCAHIGCKEFISFYDIVKPSKSIKIQEAIWEKMCTRELGWYYDPD
jgi:hypothetical protein